MRKTEKKEFYKRLTKYVGKAIDKWNLDGWLDKELYNKTGIIQTRLTEIKNFDKYGRPITEKYLAAFIGGGIVTTKDLIKHVATTQEEIQHIKDLEFYGDEKQRIESNKLKDLGVNPAENSALARQLKEAGIDPIKVMKAALEEANKE